MDLQAPKQHRTSNLLPILCVSCAAFLILGYHPYAEDGGVYFTALLQAVHPLLFPQAHDFAAAHLHHSAYLYLLASVARLAPGHLDAVLFTLHLLSIVATVGALFRIACDLFPNGGARFAAAVASTCLSLPLAGTALYLADPYVTARSLSTPLLLLGVSFALRRRAVGAAAIACITIAIHPLMGLWGAIFLAILWCAGSARPRASLALLSIVIFLGSAVLFIASPLESQTSFALAQTRAYWYLQQWQWFEWIGLLAPPTLVAVQLATQARKSVLSRSQRDVAIAIVTTFSLSTAISIAFVHPASHHLLLARMQPLRMLHIAYLLFFVLFGHWLGELFSRHRLTRIFRWPVLIAIAVILGSVQRSIYPASSHIEAPSRTTSNAWVAAFTWIRNNTREDAVIALDPKYTSFPGEDAQNARAITRRSILPDFSKDGGVASVETSLGERWKQGVEAQRDLDSETDVARRHNLQPYGVSWVVLWQASATSLPCAYANGTVKVCRLD